MADDAYRLRPVGVVRSPLVRREDAPRQGSEGAPDAWIILNGLELAVGPLEAIDGTPVVDIKSFF